MPNFSQDTLAVGPAGFNSTDPTVAGSPLLSLGFRAASKDGRVYRWCLNGGTSTVAGSLYQSAAQITNHQNMTTAAAAIGLTTVTVTPGNTAGAQNLYAEGYLITHAATGIGYTYAVSSHLAITASTAFVVNLRVDDPIQVALDSTTKCDIIANPFQNVIVSPTSGSGVPVGVSTYIITNAQNGWLQVGGVCGTLINGTPAVGQMVIPSATTAGALDIASSTGPVVGFMMVTGVSTKVQPVALLLDF